MTHDHDTHEHGAHQHDEHEDQHPESPAVQTGRVVCPVMPDHEVDPAVAEQRGLFRDYQGSRYWFCCADCERQFDADPARYANAA